MSYELAGGANVQTLRTTNDAGTTAIDLTGNSLDNSLIGNAGVNILDGKGGADDMHGLGGNDIYFVNHADDDRLRGRRRRAVTLCARRSAIS